jgi:primosomal protein N' (replication factor Y)
MDGKGKVMIQTMNPSHPVLQQVAHHDFLSMYSQEIEKRKQFFYPPFSRIINIHFRDKERDVVFDAANSFAKALETPWGKYIVGPAEPVVNRVRNMFLMELLLKLPRDSQLIHACKRDILKECANLHTIKRFKKIIIVPDVDAI